MVLDVIEVVLEFLDRFFHGPAIGIAYLRPAGQAGLDAVPNRIERNLVGEHGDERRTLWPRADKAHFALEDVKQLRQLVDARAAHEASDGCHPWVVDARPRLTVLLGILGHAAELEQREGLATVANPFLPVDDWRAAFAPDQAREDAHERQRDRQQRERKDDVGSSLQDATQPGLAKTVAIDEPARLERVDRDTLVYAFEKSRQVGNLNAAEATFQQCPQRKHAATLFAHG